MTKEYHQSPDSQPLPSSQVVASERGEAFKLRYPALLSQLEELLSSDFSSIPSNLTIGQLKESGESISIQVELDKKVFLLKRAKANSHKSFLQEKSQLDLLQQSLQPSFNKAGVRAQTYYFFARQWCFVDFEVGKPLSALSPELHTFLDTVESYLENTENPVLIGLMIDLMPSNFIYRNDGQYVWVDPFYPAD
ncbi:MAG: hypothetical protein M3Q81_05240 [bacterium]|nr:hypothetical protein [bacterium]